MKIPHANDIAPNFDSRIGSRDKILFYIFKISSIHFSNHVFGFDTLPPPDVYFVMMLCRKSGLEASKI